MPLSPSSSPSSSSSRSRSKRQIDKHLTLIPGLPNDVAALILSFVPYPQQLRLKSTCKSWCVFLSSETLVSLRSKHSVENLSHILCIFPQDPSIAPPYLFDTATLSWRALPLMPCNPHEYGLCNFSAVSLGPHLYVIGGSLFDTRSYPLDRPMASSSAFRYNFLTSTWEKLAPMITPRGSFACTAFHDPDRIIVAGGGSRHAVFGAGGSRMSSVEMYDVERDEWVGLNGLPKFRAGCLGFLAGGKDERQFWVMGGYGEARTVSGILPVDEHYRDALVMELEGSNDGGKWREVGDMWGVGQSARPGKIVVVEDENHCSAVVFMLHYNEILRYNMASNRWEKESDVPRKVSFNKSFGLIALKGELHVMTVVNGTIYSTEPGQMRQHVKVGSLYVQIYDPRKKTWRFVVTKPPFSHQLDFSTAVMCTIYL